MKRILPVIVLSQFFCTSLWFAGNAVMSDMAKQLQLEPSYLAYLTSAVQLGFITGTLVFAILSIADRFSPVRVFFICALIAAFINALACLSGTGAATILILRYSTGFFLAGIYPVGMKIASDHYPQGLGKALGFLVGALVLGTSFPHLLKSLMGALPWRYVILSTSALAALGGCAMVLLVPDGAERKPTRALNPAAFIQSFGNRQFRAAAFGYFGHMWELYAFWAFVPVMLTTYNARFIAADLNVPLLSFLIIGAGALACAGSGIISKYKGVKNVAVLALTISCTCCLVSPLFLFAGSAWAMIGFLLVWSTTAIADSPLFSTLVAQNADQQLKGTALTIVNCIGFAITIISIQLIAALRTAENARYIYMLLAIGPVWGLMALINGRNTNKG
ncbi:MFS transporter [Mucilaginibacter sp. P19]|uniref:Predicted arabinose efflux permease, MFS family n=1 Tax=Mucilaginibacter gossypii TaxID=551996 RepID=A0A1G8HWX9_9SPHI|nr:MFS transporter [Mucilaginibacter gossypii]SDI11072.1 Predicted arabinose efflux permease, MFS family [Mucilaginibacter gossypii]